MKRKLSQKKRIALIGLCMAIVAVWTWRYLSVNRFYDARTTRTIAYYAMEDEVPIGTESLTLQESVDGYYVHVKDFEIVDFFSYCENNGISLDTRQNAVPDKLALVRITLGNVHGDESGINISDFGLQGIDSYPTLDYDLLGEVNPTFSGAFWGIVPPQNSEYEITIPYMLSKENYKVSTWNNIDNYKFYLKFSDIPVIKCIKLEI